ncbi:MAG: hypothetical protein A3A33_04285 [Candidatus Yanofskybacteria bacterium RIFCSPLOWO2_01_FULL_49_25]|uniref:YdbS-like PH domain-containing protein n=1 Tax=Candidatus Yanofskybacteria bacterium RIFCSPLOWO2_01_FULL_49_25 TaxID=1802701 RepID=A0A1F8GTI7_9BACT|nr:MAG: hypothetical protein A3A33_04285 [Candidatus Yanofskybacteria bacterium RIFCSPLOWO2_01_FULL_49_25]
MAFDFLTDTSYTFEDKKSYENVILLLRRHWFTLFLKFLGYLLLGLLPLIAYIGIRFMTSSSLGGLLGLIAVIYYLIWWYGLFYVITMYLLDVWIVSDHRVIDSEQHGFFNRTVAELSLEKIQDISVQIVGFFPTWLDYGELQIQTAGTQEKFFFKEIPDPVGVKDAIVEAHNQFIELHRDGIEVHEQPFEIGSMTPLDTDTPV